MRKTQFAKSNFDEKLTSEFTPYTAAQDIPRLEDGRCIRHRNVNECAISALGFLFNDKIYAEWRSRII